MTCWELEGGEEAEGKIPPWGKWKLGKGKCTIILVTKIKLVTAVSCKWILLLHDVFSPEIVKTHLTITNSFLEHLAESTVTSFMGNMVSSVTHD